MGPSSPGQGVTISILGTKYTVVSDTDDGHVRALADFLNAKLDEYVPARNMALLQRVILTALNIADELFQERRRFREQLEEIGRRTEELIAAVDDSEKGAGRISATSGEEV